jgi:hypothetical protein
MEITNFRRGEGPDGTEVARFDVDLTDDVRLLHWILKRGRAGELRVFPPTVRHIGGTGTAAAVAPELFNAITAAAISCLDHNGDRP